MHDHITGVIGTSDPDPLHDHITGVLILFMTVR